MSQEALQQQQQALEGKLPVNPLVTQTLQQQQKQLQTTLSNNLGPGYGASTPGEQAQNNFNVSQAGIIQAANTGQMTLDQQLASAGTANYIGSNQNTLQSILGINGLGFATAGAYGQGANNYTNAMSPYMQQNQMSLQAQMSNAQMAASQQQGQGALIGSGMGAALWLAQQCLCNMTTAIQFSGGKDSVVCLHMYKDKPNVYAYYVDSGAAFPHVRLYIQDTCKLFGVPLRIVNPRRASSPI